MQLPEWAHPLLGQNPDFHLVGEPGKYWCRSAWERERFINLKPNQMKVEGLTFKEYMEYNAAEEHNIIHTCSLLLSFSQCDLDFLASLSFLCLQVFFSSPFSHKVLLCLTNDAFSSLILATLFKICYYNWLSLMLILTPRLVFFYLFIYFSIEHCKVV